MEMTRHALLEMHPGCGQDKAGIPQPRKHGSSAAAYLLGIISVRVTQCLPILKYQTLPKDDQLFQAVPSVYSALPCRLW